MHYTTLFRLQHTSRTFSFEPILPLHSPDIATFRTSPLYQHRQPDEDEHGAASRYAGPGPWVIKCDLRLPDATQGFHPSTPALNRTNVIDKNLSSNVRFDHGLRIVFKVKKDDEGYCDAESHKWGQGKDGTRLYEISMHAPITILSVSL